MERCDCSQREQCLPRAPIGVAILGPFEKWTPLLRELSRQYRENQPCPHIHLTDFIDSKWARAMASDFPRHRTEAWTHYKHHNENKLGLSKRGLFPSTLGQLVDELNSPQVVEWVSQLVGIPHLLADEMLEGGGLHQCSRGGFLNVHTDFSTHHYHKHWRRRVNLILYLNPTWREDWGGALELWGHFHEALRREVPASAESCGHLYNRRALAPRLT